MTDASILEDYVAEAEFAEAHRLSQRTVARYRKQPDGLPFVEFGGRIFIHIPSAKTWLNDRLRQLNPTNNRRERVA
jgi:hypothetical protein